MQYHDYSPLVYKSLGYSDPNSLLSNLGSQYGYIGAYNPQQHSQYGVPGSDKTYTINNQTFKTKQDYENFNSFIGSRATFLDQQLRDNAEAYSEFAKNPYAFQGTNPLKTAAQKAAEVAAAKAAATAKTQGGTAKGVGTTVAPIIGQTGQTAPITNRIRPSAIPSGNIDPKTGLPVIPANNEALLGELQKLLGQIPGLFDLKGITKGFNDRIAMDESFGHQSANNAASEFASRTAAEGGDASLAGLVRAQALLPVLQHSGELKSELADKRLAAGAAQGNLTATVAQALGNLRTNYLQGLVDYTGKIQDIQSTNQTESNRLNESSRQFDLGHTLDVGKLKILEKQQSEEEKANKLRAILAAGDLNKGRVNPNKSTYYPGLSQGGPLDPTKVEYNDSIDNLIAQLQGLY